MYEAVVLEWEMWKSVGLFSKQRIQKYQLGGVKVRSWKQDKQDVMKWT